MNQTLLNALRAFTNNRGSDWDLRLPTCELAYNSSIHSATGVTPFMLDIGVEARLPFALTRHEREEVPPNAAEFIDDLHGREVDAFRSMLAAQQRDKHGADGSRRLERYELNEYAWLDTRDLQHTRAVGSKKLRSRWIGPYRVIGVKGT